MSRSLMSLAAGLLVFGAAGAQAQGYVGAAAGWTKIDVDCAGVEAAVDAKCDSTSTGGKIYGGYRFGSQFAVEAVYFDWGKATARYTDEFVDNGRRMPFDGPPLYGTVTVSGKLRATGYGLGVAYFMPISSSWSGVARLGVAQNKGKLTLTETSEFGSSTGSASKTQAQPYFGLGIGYKMGPNLMLTGEADFSRVKYGAGGEYETDAVRLLSVGVSYAF